MLPASRNRPQLILDVTYSRWREAGHRARRPFIGGYRDEIVNRR